ncbi:hypothetical protein, partial [Enterococcus faecium]|uniref:hypothetical protein n=1 Tax=Enterococcus faecium TaxID=1352 RepID=UPI00293132A0
NLVNFLRTIGFEEVQKGMTIHSIRLKFLKVAGKLVQTGRRVYIIKQHSLRIAFILLTNLF